MAEAPKSDQLLQCMILFRDLYRQLDDMGINPLMWRDRARAYGKLMVDYFSSMVEKFVYLHMFVCHGWRWVAAGGLGMWSSHAVEGVNKCMQKAKWDHSTRDKLEEDPPITTLPTTSSSSSTVTMTSGSGCDEKKKKTRKEKLAEQRPQQCQDQLIQCVQYCNRRASEVLVGIRIGTREYCCSYCHQGGHNCRNCPQKGN